MSCTECGKPEASKFALECVHGGRGTPSGTPVSDLCWAKLYYPAHDAPPLRSADVDALRAEVSLLRQERDAGRVELESARASKMRWERAHENAMLDARRLEAELAKVTAERDAAQASVARELHWQKRAESAEAQQRVFESELAKMDRAHQERCEELSAVRAEAAALRAQVRHTWECSVDTDDQGGDGLATGAGDCDCGANAALLSSTAGRELLEELADLRERHRWVVCTYCGEKYERASADMPVQVVDHLLACEKRPEKVLAAEIEQLRAQETLLVEFFCSESGARIGAQGDHDNLSPAQTAIQALAELERLRSDFAEADGHIAECQGKLVDLGFQVGPNGQLLDGIGQMQEELERLRLAIEATTGLADRLAEMAQSGAGFADNWGERVLQAVEPLRDVGVFRDRTLAHNQMLLESNGEFIAELERLRAENEDLRESERIHFECALTKGEIAEARAEGYAAGQQEMRARSVRVAESYEPQCESCPRGVEAAVAQLSVREEPKP